MAKTKPRTVAEIPDPELKRLAASLLGTTHNVFTRAMLNWGDQLVAGDDLFDRLKAECGVEKCEQCDVWVRSNEMDADVSGICTGCVDAIDGRADDGDE